MTKGEMFVVTLLITAITAILITVATLTFGLASKNADDPHCPRGTAWVAGDTEAEACIPVVAVPGGSSVWLR